MYTSPYEPLVMGELKDSYSYGSYGKKKEISPPKGPKWPWVHMRLCDLRFSNITNGIFQDQSNHYKHRHWQFETVVRPFCVCVNMLSQKWLYRGTNLPFQLSFQSCTWAPTLYRNGVTIFIHTRVVPAHSGSSAAIFKRCQASKGGARHRGAPWRTGERPGFRAVSGVRLRLGVEAPKTTRVVVWVRPPEFRFGL